MDKYILDVNRKIIVENFDDFLPVFLGAYNKKNKNLFFNCSSNEEFLLKLNLDDTLVKKEFFIIKSQLNEKLVDRLYSNFDEVIEVLQNEKLNLSWIENLNKDSLIKCLYKSIYNFYKSDEKIFSDDIKTEDIEYVENWLNDNESLLNYLFIFYEYNQLLKSDLKFKDKLKLLFESYLKKLVNRYNKDLLDFKVNELNEKIKNLKKDNQKLEKIIESKKSKNIKLVNEKKNIKSKYKKKMKKLESRNKRKLSKLNKKINKLKEENKTLLDTMISKKEYNLKRKEAKKYLDKLKDYKEKYYKLKEQKDDFQVSILTVEKYLKTNGVNKKLSQLIRLYDDSLITGNINNKYIDKHLYKIAYVSIEDNNHYYIDSKGNKKELVNLPDEIYLQNNQFIAVSSNNIFIKSFDYIFNKNDKLDFKFYEVIDTDPVKVYLNSDEHFKINTNGKEFKKGEIVNLDSNYQLVGKRNKRVKNRLSLFFESIKSKKHKLIYIDKKLANGFTGIDLIKNEEIIVSNNFDILPNSIITIYNNKLINRFKFSSYLKDIEIFDDLDVGYFIKKDFNKYIEDIDGTRLSYDLFFNRNNFDLKDGSVIGLDRFKNIIKVYDNESNTKKTDEQRILEHKSSKKLKSKSTNKEIIYDKSFLIIGNESLSNRYIKSFKNKGVKVDFVSGHEKYHKIFTKAKDFENILFITKAASHENYYKLKDDFTDKLIYINFQGANRLIRYVFENEIK